MDSALVMLPCSLELVNVRDTLVAALEALLPPSGSGEGDPHGDAPAGTAEGRSKLLPRAPPDRLKGQRPPLAEATLKSRERRR